MATTNEYAQLHEIDTDVAVNTTIFTPDGEHLVGATNGDVRVWRVADGKRVATLPMGGPVPCVTASGDGKWIAAGTWSGELVLLDPTTFKRVFVGRTGRKIHDIDFSPESTHLVFADEKGTATIWCHATRRKVRTLDPHSEPVYVAKYSPRGNRIATATLQSVRVWDSNDGRLLAHVEVQAKGWRSLLWSGNYLLVQTIDGKVKEIDAATGSTVSEWLIPDAHDYSRVALPQHGNFIAYSAEKSIAFCDPATHAQLSLIPYAHDIFSFSFSFDGSLLAIALTESKLIVKELIQPVSNPEFDIGSAALSAWKHGRLTDAEVLLSAAFPTSGNRAHYVLASRALVRARLAKWDLTLVDAKESIKIRPSVIGYVALYVARVSNREVHAGCQVCDIACFLFPSEHVTLLLIKAIVLSMAGEHVDAISRMDDLITHARADPAFHIVQAYMYLLLGNKRVQSSNYELAIQSFEDALAKLGNYNGQLPLIISLISGWCFDDLAITIQQRLCEALLIAGRTKEAGKCVLRMVDQGSDMTGSIETWISDFKSKCCSKLEELGDAAMSAQKYDEAISQYTAALTLKPAAPQLLLKRSNAWAGKGAPEDAMNDAKEWARSMLTSGSWGDALTAGVGFVLERFLVYQILCEHLETNGRVADAISCFHRMSSELAQKKDEEQADWIRNFKSRCLRKAEDLGDSAVNAKQYDEAVSQYTAALSLHPTAPQDLLVKRSKAYTKKGNGADGLNDANEVIKLDPSSPSGYESKYAALFGMGRYDDAISAFETMLSKMSESSDPEIRERSYHYVRPEQTKEAIRTAIKSALCDSPEVLINTSSGRMCDKSQQAAAFESTPAFTRLVASMTTQIDRALVEQVVGEFYRYATLSHTWEVGEPLYEKVIKIVVYDLEASPTHEKLRMFCKVVRDEGFTWAWSDTCCINKGDHFVLQEALVSMFKWYEGSAMTIIFLFDVERLAKLGALTESRWNSRGWTFQEYHASKVVRIYTKDWTPYLGITIHNHKESPEVISEMEKATSISAQALMAIRPGLSDIREKLRLASTRQTTRVEDSAYSLLGIFSMTLPVTYGEGDKALGRLLSQLLMSSGDTCILAWSGVSGSYNTCLPTSIAVFSQPLTSYIPPAIPEADMNAITAGLHASSLDLDLVTRLYDEVDNLPTSTFAGQRMRLPCLFFMVRLISRRRDKSGFVFRVQAGVLGDVDIKTKQDFTPEDSLYLVHPWIDFLLDRRAAGKKVETVPRENKSLESDEYVLFDSSRGLSSASYADSLDTGSLPSPSTLLSMNAQIRAYEFLARLRQPFGALLLRSNPRNAAEYNRVSTESLITVQVEEIKSTTLHRLLQCVRVLDVL